MSYPERLRAGLKLGLQYGGSGMRGVFARSNWYYRFDGLSYGVFADDVVIGAGEDFEIEFDFFALNDGYLMSGSQVSENTTYTQVTSGGTIRVGAYIGTVGQPELTSTTVVNDLAWHHFQMTYDGTTARLYIDGAEESSVLWALPDGFSILQYVGNRVSFGYLDGIISDIKATVGTQLAANVPLDQKGSDVQRNRADSSNPITFQNPDHAENWYEYEAASGYYLGANMVTVELPLNSSAIGGSPVTTYDTGADIVAGASYQLTLVVSEYLGTGNLGFAGSDVTDGDLYGNGSISGVFVANQTSNLDVFTRTTNQCVFESIVCREVLNP